MSEQKALSLRPVVESEMDADAAWLRASVEAFEPRLRELERRGEETAGPGAWGDGAGERPDLGCGWGCRCCAPRFAGRAFFDLDRWAARPWNRRRDGGALLRRLENAVRGGRPVVLGARVDPYGGGAAHRARTRRLLDACRDLDGAELALTTASPLVLCDLDLLVELDGTSSLSIELVTPSADAALARRLEPGAPPPAERLGAVAEIAAQGIAVRLRVAPLLPGIAAGEAALRPLLDAARGAGAADVAASPLRLPWRARRPFLAWLATEEPDLLPRYGRLYHLRATAPAAERRALLADFHRLRLEHGFPRGIAGRG
jgi:DNA repair photolyase